MIRMRLVEKLGNMSRNGFRSKSRSSNKSRRMSRRSLGAGELQEQENSRSRRSQGAGAESAGSAATI